MTTAWSSSTSRFWNGVFQAYQSESEQTLPQKRQLFCGTEEARCGAQDGGVFPV
jgi:hypothetical protein